jgi:hypothetical protein
MRDLFNFFRSASPQSQALHFSYEKAGLTLDNQPIPWNAEAVLVEANVRLPSATLRNKNDFGLRLGEPEKCFFPEVLRQDHADGPARLFFRLPVPARSTTAELIWRDRSLGQVTLPVIAAEEFVGQLALEMPTLHVRLGEQMVACQTFVTSQCQGLAASAVLTSPTSLAPIADLELRLEVRREDGTPLGSTPIRLTSSQLRARQALITLVPTRPRRSGTWTVQWLLGEHLLASVRLRAISKRQFLRSLRISATRFILQSDRDEISLVRTLPALHGIRRVGPCFLISSGEAGMAGLADVQVRVQVGDDEPAPLLHQQELLVTDGPVPLVPGTVNAADLAQVKHFSLESEEGVVGVMPLLPAPTARFDGEGAFAATEDFVWSSAAEEQLNERLSKLLGGP